MRKIAEQTSICSRNQTLNQQNEMVRDILKLGRKKYRSARYTKNRVGKEKCTFGNFPNKKKVPASIYKYVEKY